MAEDTPITRVILRRFRDVPRDVIAMFPDDETGFGKVNSYMRVGQHGDASTSLIYSTDPAHEDEPDVADLLRELRGMGYRLDVRKRWPTRGRNG